MQAIRRSAPSSGRSAHRRLAAAIACAGACAAVQHQAVGLEGDAGAQSGAPSAHCVSPCDPGGPRLVRERVSWGDARGEVELWVGDQRLELRLVDGAREHRLEAWIPELVPHGFFATAFTQVGAGELLLGGCDPSCGGGALALLEVDLDPDLDAPRFEDDPLRWAGAGLEAVTDVARLPGSTRVVVLDAVGGGLFTLDLAEGRLRKVADARAFPALWEARHLIATPLAPGSAGVEVLAAQVDAEGLSLGRHVGPYVRLLDADGDGAFELVR